MTESKSKSILEVPSDRFFGDISILSRDYIPNIFKHREDQIAELNYYFTTVINYKMFANTLFLFGPSGTGKTHVVKKMLDELGEAVNLRVCYAKSYKTDTAHSFFRELLESSFGIKMHPRENMSAYFDEFERMVNKHNVLLVIDDIQFLVDKDPHGFNRIMHYLSRIGDNIGMLLIGNIDPAQFTNALSPPTISSLRMRSVYFPAYNAKQLGDIVNDRINAGAFRKNSIPSGVTTRACAMTAQQWGSARFVLDLMIEIGRIVESTGKSAPVEGDVEKAFERIETSRLREQLGNLPRQPFAVLEAINRTGVSKHANGKETYTGEIYEEYIKVCAELALKELSQRRMADLLAELDQDGLVTVRSYSKGRYGKTNKVRWTINTDVFEEFRRAKLML